MKQNKFLGVLALALSLGLSGCGDDKVAECEKHTWGDKETLKAATCTEAGESQRTCTVCGAKEDVKPIKALGHDWEDDTSGGKDPTCTDDGNIGQHCKRCTATQTRTIKALGHDWVDDTEGLVPATCTVAGSKNQHCSRCTEKQENVAIPALGHDFGDWAIVEGKAPTCEGKGEEARACKREGCTEVETREVAALGHKPTTADTAQPEAGKAAVRVYTCENGCGQKFLGFRANEVTDASKARLTIGTDGGASFWGRPIGNSLALDASGTSVNQQNNECVYCRDEQGDFFEYVFDLTSEQLATLGSTCRLYCDAMPADHLSGDFWAYNSSNTDWTPGYYIDDDEDHIEKNEDGTVKKVKNHTVVSRDSQKAGDETEDEVPMGKRITNYRYVLYVDGDVKDFDPDTKVTVEAGVRKEYVMPYTFNLHTGENRISLRMAGGYRSTFYNFTFRPYVEPTQLTVNEAAVTVTEGQTATITSTFDGLTFKSDNAAVATVDANGVVTGVAAGSTTITVSKAGNFKDAKVPVTVNEPAGIVRAEVENGTSENNAVTFRKPSGSGCSGDMTNAFPKDAVLTIKFNAEAAGAYEMYLNARGGSNSSATNAADAIGVKINGADVTLSGEIAGGYSFSQSKIGEVNLVNGENTIEIKALLDTMPNLDFFRFVPKAQA